MDHKLGFFHFQILYGKRDFNQRSGSREPSGQTHKGKMEQDWGEGVGVLITEASKKTNGLIPM